MSTPPPRRTTLHDVAERAGVSYQTVSRVINNHPNVAEATRQRVQDAIHELNYRPNRVAQSLVTSRSQTLALVTFGMDYYGPAQMVIHIERAAHDAGYALVLANLADTDEDELRAAVDSLSGRGVDGIIMITPVVSLTPQKVQALDAGAPIVQIDTQIDADVESVLIDQHLGGCLATQHLIDLGHRDIYEIRGPLEWIGATARHVGWLDTLQNNGLQPGQSVEGMWTAASGYQAAQRLIEGGAPFTAMVVGNDQMALGAMRALTDAGLRVPEDVSVVGFDDVPEAAYYNPPLTTVRQDFDALGRQAVECLIQRINNPTDPPHQHVITPALIVRRSTAPV